MWCDVILGDPYSIILVKFCCSYLSSPLESNLANASDTFEMIKLNISKYEWYWILSNILWIMLQYHHIWYVHNSILQYSMTILPSLLYILFPYFHISAVKHWAINFTWSCVKFLQIFRNSWKIMLVVIGATCPMDIVYMIIGDKKVTMRKIYMMMNISMMKNHHWWW